MLDTLVIRDFKSILNLNISLGKVNIFIGANGSGKSNILEALGILSAAASGRVDDPTLNRKGVRPGIPRLYKSAFNERISPHIYFEAKSTNLKYSVTLNNPLEKPKPAWLFKTEELYNGSERLISRSPLNAKNDTQGYAALKIVESNPSEPISLFFDILRDYSIFCPTTLTLRGLVNDGQTREPVGISGGKLTEGLQNLISLAKSDENLSEAVEEVKELIDWANSFDIVPASTTLLSGSLPRPKNVIRFHDRYMRKGKNTLTAYDASEGALYILFTAILALSPNSPQCFAIDNFDQALNPRLVMKLTSTLCNWILNMKYDRQILMTAHNPAVLDGLPLKDDRIRLFSVDRNSHGATELRRIEITEELEAQAKEKQWPLSRLWIMGYLGGVPNV
ncbi:MAG: chromosome segregation protein SMC [Spirochaetes bacterium GWF1_51_8]|nr:MAG: chromosome segregation protein SMC [Spirochaetes bacterium GWF1_51_8]